MPQSQSDWTVEYAEPVLRDGLEQLIDRVTPGLIARLVTDADAHDEQIAVLALAVSEAEELLRDAVIAARMAGRTWTQIAEALGVDRAAAQTRFTARDSGAESVNAPETNSALESAAPSIAVGSRRKLQPINRMSEMNLLGPYGWHVVDVGLSTGGHALVCTVELDDQQWEHALTKRKSQTPDGFGWVKVDQIHRAWVGGYYWARPTGIPTLAGNTEPKNVLGL